VDESGDFTFSSRGSKYYVVAVAWTYNPVALATNLNRLRFSYLKNGRDIQHFHACVDARSTRNAVFEEMVKCDDWNFAATVVQKNKVGESLRSPQHFYPRFAAMPIRFVLRGRLSSGTTRVLIYTDTLAVQQNRRAVEKALKRECSGELNVPWYIYHHSSRSNAWLQVADYACWAVQRKWEMGDESAYQQIRCRLVAQEHDVLAREEHSFY
jgi:hypothetical protein